MKTRMVIYPKTIWGALFIILLTVVVSASAHSGRIVQTPVATTPTPPATSLNKSGVKRGIVTDGSDDAYKLVFPTVYQGKRFYRMDKERKALALADISQLKGFIEQLNKVGEQGYKLTSAITRGIPVGIAKFDEGQYEYAAFDTTTNTFFGLGGFEEIFAGLSRRGFRLTDHFLISSYCEFRDPDSSAMGEDCEYVHRFLLEREKGVERPKPHVLVGSAPGWRSKPSVELLTQISQGLSQGYYPTNVLSKFWILLERPEKNDEGLTDEPDVQVVRSPGRGDMMTKVNELGKQGYRLALINDGIAVMSRHAESATPVTYVFLKTEGKSWEKQLAQLQETGAVYRMTCPDVDGAENCLVFEQDQINGPRREYRILKFEFRAEENAAEKKVHIDLASPYKGIMKDLNGLVKEGFVVRDLFVSDKISVLLERMK